MIQHIKTYKKTCIRKVSSPGPKSGYVTHHSLKGCNFAKKNRSDFAFFQIEVEDLKFMTMQTASPKKIFPCPCIPSNFAIFSMPNMPSDFRSYRGKGASHAKKWRYILKVEISSFILKKKSF